MQHGLGPDGRRSRTASTATGDTLTLTLTLTLSGSRNDVSERLRGERQLRRELDVPRVLPARSEDGQVRPEHRREDLRRRWGASRRQPDDDGLPRDPHPHLCVDEEAAGDDEGEHSRGRVGVLRDRHAAGWCSRDEDGAVGRVDGLEEVLDLALREADGAVQPGRGG